MKLSKCVVVEYQCGLSISRWISYNTDIFLSMWYVSLCFFELWFASLLCPRDFSGKNIGMGCISSSKRSSQPRDLICITCVSCTGIMHYLLSQLGNQETFSEVSNLHFCWNYPVSIKIPKHTVRKLCENMLSLTFGCTSKNILNYDSLSIWKVLWP